MCGLAALIPNSKVSPEVLISMNRLIRHRGPDDEGFAFFKGSRQVEIYAGEDTPDDVLSSAIDYAPKIQIDKSAPAEFKLAFTHRRLSILDLSANGHQPMPSVDKRYWLVFNGEIYNHIELRMELQELGHKFRTHTDTEVILAAYSEWGKRSFEKLRGMFAFLIYDLHEESLIAVRDRFGIKPLYYRISEFGIAFASEIKQFTALPDWKPVMNGQRVFDFLNWSITDHTDETLFEGVFQLRGGQCTEIQLRTLNLRKPGAKLDVENWYNLDPSPFHGDFNNAVDRIRTLLTKSVDIHLRADVPIGSCLSGGLDSSAIVCLANKSLRSLNSESLQKTFSACVKVKHLDERKFMEEVVKATGVQAHFVYPTSEDLFNTYKQIGWHQDEPFGSSSIHAQWTIFKLAAENNVKVMLDGQGADEQLAGYHNFFGPYFAGLFKRGRWLRLFTEMRATKILHKHSYTKSIKWIGNMLLPEWIRQSLRGWSGKANSRPNWINFGKLGAIPGDPFTEIGFKSSSLRDFSVAQLSASNLQMLLHWEDRDSMAHSIESRVPFLDHEFVECVVSLPDSFKLEAGVTKRVLRSAMAEALPPSVTHRMDKLGFVTPEEYWLREEATEKFRQALVSAIENSEGILNQNILATFEEIVTGRRPFSQVIWRVISFGSWMETFKVKASYK